MAVRELLIQLQPIGPQRVRDHDSLPRSRSRHATATSSEFPALGPRHGPSLPPPSARLGPSVPPCRRRRRAIELQEAKRHQHRAATVSAVAAETPRSEQEPSPSPSGNDDAFDWLDQWYPFAPVCDLDPGAPHGKTVLGLSVVAWHDRRAGEWRVFDDACPHRLAPLSEGRVDDKGRSSASTMAGASTAPAHASSSRRLRHSARRCTRIARQAEYKDVLQRKRPPFIAEIDDPEFVTSWSIRDLVYGYDILVENLMDPAHVPYAHKGLILEYDEEGGGPIKMKIEMASMDGFLTAQDQGSFQFIAPCTFYGSPFRQEPGAVQGKKKTPRFMLVFFCVPVAPGRSRLIWAFPRNVGVWLDKIMPRWFYHISQNRVLDSDIYLLHVEERKSLRQALITGRKFAMCPLHQTTWSSPSETGSENSVRTKLAGQSQKSCTSCSAALKAMKALEVALQVASIAVIGFLAVAKGTLITSTVQRATIVSVAVLCFAASRWLGIFIEKSFYFQDYIHAYK
ncbi:hypothetical protein PR202_ga13865 [Eleusine coracana subsp. coracana]|uniref:Rieske domain-containing protein n=1 Tax=Eleusine coracana subsp. coracana TaxID=191504 RepID=A0AAV5CFD4_ELECO|nr:hypothetical protein PR202_ga13865 [Eleusine coracana subsp. coracana]